MAGVDANNVEAGTPPYLDPFLAPASGAGTTPPPNATAPRWCFRDGHRDDAAVGPIPAPTGHRRRRRHPGTGTVRVDDRRGDDRVSSPPLSRDANQTTRHRRGHAARMAAAFTATAPCAHTANSDAATDATRHNVPSRGRAHPARGVGAGRCPGGHRRRTDGLDSTLLNWLVAREAKETARRSPPLPRLGQTPRKEAPPASAADLIRLDDARRPAARRR